VKRLVLIAMVVLLTASISVAQEPCTADFDCNGNVDADDVTIFLSQFGRNPFNDPCPVIPCPITCEGMLSTLGRWCDQGNGTVKDMATRLVWLQDTGCMGVMNWYSAIEQPITNLRDGNCGLTDGSVWGDWRLPTKSELVGITVGTEPILVSGPWYFFTGVQSYDYWSSTTNAYSPNFAWHVGMGYGGTDYDGKDWLYNVWPVRGGHATTTTTTITTCIGDGESCLYSSDCCNGCCCSSTFGDCGFPNYCQCVPTIICEDLAGDQCQ
jgi:hypothetical protein